MKHLIWKVLAAFILAATVIVVIGHKFIPHAEAACSGTSQNIQAITVDAATLAFNPGIGVETGYMYVTGRLYEYGSFFNHQFIGCNDYYATVTGTDPDPNHPSSPSFAGNVAIWLYDGNNTYKASTAVLVPNNSTTTSAFTNTVTSTNGIKIKLGYQPASNEPYCWSLGGLPTQTNPISDNPCYGLYGPYSA
jgi:hypothetical protein